jgi:hypothetical protein
MSSTPATTAQGSGVVKGTDAEADFTVKGIMLGWQNKICLTVAICGGLSLIHQKSTCSHVSRRLPLNPVCTGTYLVYLGS